MANTGRIRDFSKPDPDAGKGPQILSAVKHQGVQVQQETPPVQVNVHEETIREGDGKVRKPGEDDGIEIRIRSVKDADAWDKARRGIE